MAFLFFNISTNIHISVFSYLIMHTFLKGLTNFFLSVKDCCLVRSDVSIRSLPGSTL